MTLLDFFRHLFARRAVAPAPVDPADESAPGREAIDGAVAPLYPGQEPRHWGTFIKWMLGGPDPLDGVSAYRADGPAPHWHYVSYGMSELYAKEWDDRERSGWGFEFTFRLAREADDEPPTWPVNLLQNLARYVFESGNAFGHGHYIPANGPIASDRATDLVALLFLRDAELPPIDTPHGRVEFLQVVGITSDEYETCRAWSSERFAEMLRQATPLLVTDLERKSILGVPELARQIAEGQARDGSSSEAVYVETLQWRQDGSGWVIEMGAVPFGDLRQSIPARLGHGRRLALFGSAQTVVMEPDEETSASGDGEVLTIRVSAESARELAQTAEPKRGRYQMQGTGIVFEVLMTSIRDEQGNVVREVG